MPYAEHLSGHVGPPAPGHLLVVEHPMVGGRLARPSIEQALTGWYCVFVGLPFFRAILVGCPT
jgi:hypothetical protein